MAHEALASAQAAGGLTTGRRPERLKRRERASDSATVSETPREPCLGTDLEQIARFIELVPVPVTVLDRHGKSLLVNQAYGEAVGLTPADIQSRKLVDAMHPDDLAAAAATLERAILNGHASADLRVLHADGRYLLFDWHLLHNERQSYILSISSDRTMERARLAEAQRQARTDAVTGVLSRLGLMERYESFRAADPGGDVVAALVDIDGFKKLNKSLGNQSGDDILKIVAHRLVGAAPETADVGRIGGDEFVVLCPASLAPPSELASNIESTLNQPLTVRGRQLKVTASIGLYQADTADSADDLLRKAGIAVYEAKQAGRSQSLLAEPGLIEAWDLVESLERELSAALHTGQFVPYFQPIVNAADRSVDCYEVLLRWVDAAGNIRPAGSFLDVAETASLLPAMSTEVRDAAINVARQVPGAKLAVNVSAPELLDPVFVDRLKAQIDINDVSADRIIVEVTEQTALLDLDQAAGVLDALRNLGFTVALDDFGSGYSSLTYLTQLPIDVVKLDRSFIRSAAKSAKARRLLSAVSAFLHQLEMTTIIEGIETEEDHQVVEELGVQMGQGWLYGRPIPAEQLTALTADVNSSTRG